MRTRILLFIVAVALTAAACSSTSSTTSADGASPSTAATTGSTGATGTTSTTAPPKATSAARPSPGCAKATVPDGVGAAQHSTMTIDGADHPVRLFVPSSVTASPSKPLPLVFDLHGLTEPADVQAGVSGWETIAERDGIIILTPQGGGQRPSWDATMNDNADYTFLTQLLDKTENDLCVDVSRVYSGGISNGGLMSSILSCRMESRIAAVGLVSGIVVPEECKTARPVPAIIFWGMRDCVLPYYGGLGPCLGMKGTVPSTPQNDANPPPVETNVGYWAGRDGCGPTPTVTKVGDHTELRTFTGCKAGTSVEFYVVSNGGHTWPGSSGAIIYENGKGQGKDQDESKGITTDEIKTTDLMWSFFQRYTVPA